MHFWPKFMTLIKNEWEVHWLSCDASRKLSAVLQQEMYIIWMVCLEFFLSCNLERDWFRRCDQRSCLVLNRMVDVDSIHCMCGIILCLTYRRWLLVASISSWGTIILIVAAVFDFCALVQRCLSGMKFVTVFKLLIVVVRSALLEMRNVWFCIISNLVSTWVPTLSPLSE